MAWLLLCISGFLEIAFTFFLGKMLRAAGTEKMLWALCVFAAMSISLAIMLRVMKELPVGTAYAVWTGIGAVGTVIMGILVFDEPAAFWRLFFIATLIASIIGLRIVSN